MLNGLDVNYRYLTKMEKEMGWPLKIEDAFNIVRPLTPEERQQMYDIAVDLSKPKGIHIIQDDENPCCLQCGNPVDVTGNCASCGRVKKEPR